MVPEVKLALHVPDTVLLIICTLFGDDKGAQDLATILKNKLMAKHITIAYHHLRQAAYNNILIMKRVDIFTQLAAILTTPLTR